MEKDYQRNLDKLSIWRDICFQNNKEICQQEKKIGSVKR
jgi:hypothetical protein